MDMSHMVIYRGADGKPGYHQTDEILDAVTFVERLRNEQGVDHARIFRLEEVQFEFRPYYRVELNAGNPADGEAPAVAAAQRPAVAPAEQAGRTQPAAEGAAAREVPARQAAPTPPGAPAAPEASGDDGIGARRGLFGR